MSAITSPRRSLQVLAAAHSYVGFGWSVVPVPHGKKRPVLPGWQNLRLTIDELEQHFSELTNIGILTGSASGGLMDVDCDVPEAVVLARQFLPPTGRIHGRPGNPHSHYWFYAEGAQYEKFSVPGHDANGRHVDTCIVEIRGNGHHTIAPPSRHPDGDLYMWDERGEPARVDAVSLRAAVVRIAAGAILARAWPGKGSRDDAALALTGWLLRAGWSVHEVDRFVVAVASAAGDEEARKRAKGSHTQADLDAGRNVYGMPKLREVLTDGITVVTCVARWLDLNTARMLGNTPQQARHEGEVDTRDDPSEELPGLTSLMGTVASFPLEVLPSELRAFVRTVAASIQCPPDYVAMPLLVYASAAIGNSACLEIKRGWREFARLWVAIVGDPGDKKSPALGAVHRVIEHRQRANHAAWVTAREQSRQQVGNTNSEPRLSQLYTSDTTIETLGDLLYDNPRGMLAVRDELAGWALSMNEYKHRGADRQHWLTLWNGASLMVNRRSRNGPLFVPRPFVSLVGGIQPDVLGELCDERGRNDGFIHRLLFVYPDRMRKVWTNAEIPDEAYEPLETLFDRLYSRDSENEPLAVTFTSAARDLWGETMTALYDEAEAPDFPMALRGPWAKLEAHIARLALVIHLIRAALDPSVTESRCEETSLAQAAHLAEYLKSHLRRVYARLIAQPDDIRLLYLVTWIRERSGTCTARDLVRAGVAGIRNSKDAHAALADIESRGWGRTELIPNPHGRPTLRITLYDPTADNIAATRRAGE